MAIAFVQETTNVGGDSTSPCVVPFSSPVSIRNGLFALVEYVENGTHIASVTDTVGTSYSLACRKLGAGSISNSVELWYGTAPTSGANDVTVTAAGGKTGINICLLAFDPGTGKVFVLDQTNTNSQSSSSNISHGSITTTADDELVLTMASFDSAFTVSTLPSGFTRRGSALTRALAMSSILSAITTTDALATTTTAEDSSCGIMSFLLEDAPPPSPIRVTQLVQSVVAASPPSPLRVTQFVQGLTVQGLPGLRVTQVVRTLITIPGGTPPPPAGCPGITEIAPIEPPDGCALDSEDTVE